VVAMAGLQCLAVDVFPIGQPGPRTLFLTLGLFVTLAWCSQGEAGDVAQQQQSPFSTPSRPGPANKPAPAQSPLSPSQAKMSPARRLRVRMDVMLFGAVGLYYAVLVGCTCLADPAQQRSLGIHQTIGPCDEKAYDMIGLQRQRYLCAASFEEDFRIQCPAPHSMELPAAPVLGSQWYTICGTRFRKMWGFVWTAAVMAVSYVGVVLFANALLGKHRHVGVGSLRPWQVARMIAAQGDAMIPWRVHRN